MDLFLFSFYHLVVYLFIYLGFGVAVEFLQLVVFFTSEACILVCQHVSISFCRAVVKGDQHNL